MINSKKGETYFEKIKTKINCINVPFETILAGNPSLEKSLNPPKVNREEFFKDLDSKTFTEVAEKYIKQNVLYK